MKTQLLLAALWFGFGHVQAEIYQSVDQDGNVVFTDLPDSQSKPVQLKQPSTYQAPALKTPNSNSALTQDEEDSDYKLFSVTAPGNGQAFWDNAGNVRVSLSLGDGLEMKAGYLVQLYLDEVAQGDPVAELSMVINNVDRGKHKLYAKLINSDGAEVLRTETVTFQVHRQSINFPARKGQIQAPIQAPK